MGNVNHVHFDNSQLNRLINQLNDAILVFNSELEILFANKQASGTFSIPMDQQLGKTARDLELNMHFSQKLKNSIKEVLSSKNQYETDLILETPTKKTYYHGTFIPDFSENGEINTILCILHDITDIHIAKQILEESNRNFRLMFDQAPLAYQSLDEQGRFLDVNQAWLTTLGYSREEIIGKWFGDFLAPDYVKAFQQRFPVFLKDGSIHSEFYMRHKNGEQRYISFEGRIGKNTDGSFKQTYCIFKDETERKTTEKKLQNTVDYLKSILETTQDAFWVSDEETRFVDVNQAFCDLLGYTREELLQMRVSDINADETPQDRFNRTQRIISTGYEQFETVHRHKDGHLIDVEITISYLGKDHGKFVCFGRDLTERKLAEEQLHKTEEQLEVAANNLEGILYVVDKDLRFQISKGKKLSVLGLEPDKIVGKTIFDYFKTKDPTHPRIVAHVRALQGETIEIETNYPPATFHTTISPLKNRKGQIIGVLGLVLDISARKQMEMELSQKSALLTKTQEIAHIGSWKHNLKTNIVTWSDQMFQIFGIEPTSFTGDVNQLIAEAIHPEDRKSVNLTNAAILKDGIPRPMDYRILLPNGKVRWIHAEGEQERDANGEVIALVGFVQDITDRKLVEISNALLTESRKKYDDVFNYSQNGLCIHKMLYTESGEPSDCEYLQVNKAFEVQTGLSSQEVLGKSVRDIYPNNQADEVIQIYSQALRTGQSIHQEIYFEPIDQWFELNVFPMKNDEFTVNIQNITLSKRAAVERERLRSQLAQAQKIDSIGQLAGGVAHDFNNTLGIIIGYTELVLDQLEPQNPLFEYIEEIQKAASRSSKLTKQLLAFARKQTIAPQIINLNTTIEGMLNMIRRLIGEDRTLAWHPGKDLGFINMDPSQIDQILVNLCVNARDATQMAGQVTIETKNITLDKAYCDLHLGFVPGNYCVLSVSDNGCGMDEDTLAHIFEPFFTTKRKGEGTGLGLSTIYGIVHQNKGNITVYSELGHGTTFTIYFPRYQRQKSDVNEVVKQEDGMNEKRWTENILLVEDEPAMLTMIQKGLEKFGYHVFATSKPEEALTIAKDNPGKIDLLITDVIMPKINGKELVTRIQSQYAKNIPCLYMSGYTADVIVHNEILEDGLEFIQKPFTSQELGFKIRQILDTHKN